MTEVIYSVADTNKLITALRNQMSEDEFNSWIDLMLSSDQESKAVALALLNSYSGSSLSEIDFL